MTSFVITMRIVTASEAVDLVLNEVAVLTLADEILRKSKHLNMKGVNHYSIEKGVVSHN